MEQPDLSGSSADGGSDKPRALRIPQWLVGLLVVLGLTLALGFYVPLSKANDKLGEQLRRLSMEYRAAIEAFETTSGQLAKMEKDRDTLQANLAKISQAETSAKDAVTKLHQSVEGALKPQIERKQLRVLKGENSVRVIIESLYLVHQHQTFVHAPGAELLCQVARTIPKNTAHPTQVLAHANGPKPASPVLGKQYATGWQLSAVLASEVATAMETCGISGKELRAVGAGHFEGDPAKARRSPARFEIFMYPIAQ